MFSTWLVAIDLTLGVVQIYGRHMPDLHGRMYRFDRKDLDIVSCWEQ